MKELVKRLWAGEVPLVRAFWDFAVIYGLLVNVLADLLLFALLANDAHIALLVFAFVLPIPYNVLVLVAVWRSAGRYEGPQRWMDWARVGIIFWMPLLTIV